MDPTDPNIFFGFPATASSIQIPSLDTFFTFVPRPLPTRPLTPPLPEIIQPGTSFFELPPVHLRPRYQIYRDIAALSIASSSLYADLPHHQIERLSKRAGNWADDEFVRGVVDHVVEDESARLQHVLLLAPTEPTPIPSVTIELVFKVWGIFDREGWEEKAERFRW